jgi:excisionase family DNA binding protein
MCKDEITFDRLPQAITYLTEQVAELKELVSELQPAQSEKHVLVGIDDACRIIQKAKPTVYALVRKGLLPSYKKGKQLYFYEDELLAWIENGRRNTSEQNYEQMLTAMQKGIRHKPKSGFNL